MSPILLLALFIGTVTLTLMSFEGGRRVGVWRSAQPNPEPGLPVRTLVASILSLLAFILGFLFNQAESHAELRRESVLQEAIALGRAYHLTDLLEEPERAELQRLIREYVDARLDANRSGKIDEGAIEQLRALQAQSWAKAVALEKSGSSGASSLVQALGDAFDVYGERAMVGNRSRIPSRVWQILYACLAVSVGAAGYLAGLSGSKKSLSSFAYAFVFSAVIVMIQAGDVPGIRQFEANHRILSELRARLTAEGQPPNSRE